jgi:heme/copper-type cytochrome/quinol oxidase subunit 2
MSARRIFSIVLVAFLVVAHATVVHACPGCKQALETAEGEQANMVNGYFWSILFMLSMPFTIFGLFAGSMYLAVRKARREQTRKSEVQNRQVEPTLVGAASNS